MEKPPDSAFPAAAGFVAVLEIWELGHMNLQSWGDVTKTTDVFGRRAPAVQFPRTV